jgi:PucR C-terminal helix-turn-helix domain
MRALLIKLAAIDSSAERGLRVIEFFDQLTMHRADIEAITRATAVLAQATAGVILDDVGETCAITAAGTMLNRAGPGAGALVSEIVVDDQNVGRAWLDRPVASDGNEWDELIIARMSLALATVYARTRTEHVHQLGLADPALPHVLIRDSSTEAETARAARLLGFTPGETVYVVAISCAGKIDDPAARMRATLATASGRRVVAAAMSATTAVLIVAAGSAPAATPGNDLAVCVGPPVPVEQAAHSWHAARRGLRFTSLPGRHWTTADELGCLVALADLDPAQVSALPDVQAIARLSESRSGHGDLELLDCLGRFGSIREIAAAQHMHHSSVAYRLVRIGEMLGFDPRTPQGQYRAHTALLLWHLHAHVPSPKKRDDAITATA